MKIRSKCNGFYLEIDKNGTKYWCNNKGKLHREDGPAVEYTDGIKYWYYNGEYIGKSWEEYTQEDFERYLRSLKIKEYW